MKTCSPCRRLISNNVASETESRVHQQPNQIFQVLAGPDAHACLVLPFDLTSSQASRTRCSSISVKGALLAALLDPMGGLMSELTGDSVIHLWLTQKRKNAQRSEALAFGPCSRLPVGPEDINVGGRHLIELDVAAGVGVVTKLFGERAVLPEGGRRKPGGFAVRNKDLARVTDRDARLLWRRIGRRRLSGAGPVQDSAFSYRR